MQRHRLALTVIATIGIVFLPNVVDAAGLPASLKIGGNELILNGSGARKKGFLQLYNGGLYLTKKSNDPKTIIDADDPMAIRIHVTSRFVSQSNMLAALDEGFQNSTDGRVDPIQDKIGKFKLLFSETISRGDTFDIIYVPTKGVFVGKNGKIKGVVEGLAFKKALFGIWLSEKPSDQGLKRAMLGK